MRTKEETEKSERLEVLGRPMSGLIHEDRVWEQWYSQSIFSQSFPRMSQKDYLLQCIGDEKERVIINYRGKRKITVAEFEEMILRYEKAFASRKFEKGEVICTIALTTPEMIAIKYAATSLGLITCNLNVFDVANTDNGENRLKIQLNNVEPRMIFVLDIFVDKVFELLNDDCFSGVCKVILPLDESLSKIDIEKKIIAIKLLVDKRKGKIIKESLSLTDFLKAGERVAANSIQSVYEEGLPCNISFTSGTTGINKAVLLSHDANNALAFQHKLGEFGFEKGETNLALVPPFLAFWDSDIIHAVLCLGGVEIIELFLDYKKIPKYFIKHNVNIGVWSQYLWSSLVRLPERQRKKIKRYLKQPIIGGERCEISVAEEFFEKIGVKQMAGFGASEVNTAFSVTHPKCLKTGTAGIPLPFNNVRIVDESYHDLTYNVPGRLLVTGPCLMNGYYKREDLTDKVFWIDSEDVKWYITGDYAVIDEDGCLTVLDRYIPPVKIKNSGEYEYVNMLDIAEVMKKNHEIKICKITYHSEKLVLHFSTYNRNIKEVIQKNVMDYITEALPRKYWPDILALYNDLPRTAVGKIDYQRLQTIGEDCCKNYSGKEKLFIVEI